MPAHRKAPGRRQDNRPQRKKADVVDLAPVSDVPRAPRGLLPASRREWAAFWESPIARAVKPAQLPTLERMFWLIDERRRIARVIRADPDKVPGAGRLVKGSQGQLVLNPLFRELSVLDSEIRNLEDRFGLTPGALAKLGLSMSEATKSMTQLSNAFNAPDDDEDDDTDGDPRLAAVQLADTDS